MKIAALVSGGVDSSVAAKIMKNKGHDIHVFYLKIWLEDELKYLGDCPFSEDLEYVHAFCEQESLPLTIINLQQEYFNRVVSYAINEVKAGRTPNPDILCNQQIKFGAFVDSISNDFDKIISGHYAKTTFNGKYYELKIAPDPIKDQTYFLSYLNQSQLAKIIFPLGDMNKDNVRKLANEYNLPNKDRKDSQGICFLGKIKYPKFIEHYLGTKKGDIIEKETGDKIGEHNGFWFYTIGQRHGLGLGGGPWYVVSKNTSKNIIVVSKEYHSKNHSRKEFEVHNINWISENTPKHKNLGVKVRHGQEIYNAKVAILSNNSVRVLLPRSDQGLASGQFAVFYDGKTCLGGGVIGEQN